MTLKALIAGLDPPWGGLTLANSEKYDVAYSPVAV